VQTQGSLESRAERPKNNGQKRNWSAFGAEQVLERVSEHFQCDLETLKERGVRNNLARRCAITLCWDHAGLSHEEIAALFRMCPSSNSVAQTIRRTKTHDAQTLKVLKNQQVISKRLTPRLTPGLLPEGGERDIGRLSPPPRAQLYIWHRNCSSCSMSRVLCFKAQDAIFSFWLSWATNAMRLRLGIRRVD
jgi:hypothetical protein